MRSRLTITVLILVCLAGCATPDDQAPSATISDSAGVSVVRLTDGMIRAAPSLDLVEIVRIGSLDGPPETQFFRLVSAQDTQDEIFLLDGGNAEVRVFSSDGTFLRSFGREGDGPGEFRRPDQIYLKGDTVIVVGQRLSLLDQDGVELGTGPGRKLEEDGYLARTIPADGSWLGEWYTRKATNAPRGQPFRESVTVYRVDPRTAERTDSLFSYELAETRLAGEFGFHVSPFFQSQPTHAIGLDGHIYYTSGDRYQIDVVDGVSGQLVRRIVGDLVLQPVTSAMVADAINAERDLYKDAPPGSEMELFAKVVDDRAALPVPATRPVLGLMFASYSGWLLVLRLDLDEDPNRTGNPSTWDLFDPEGLLHGRLVLPPKTRVLRLTDDGILAVVRDELDVQFFVQYRFQIRGPSEQ